MSNFLKIALSTDFVLGDQPSVCRHCCYFSKDFWLFRRENQLKGEAWHILFHGAIGIVMFTWSLRKETSYPTRKWVSAAKVTAWKLQFGLFTGSPHSSQQSSLCQLLVAFKSAQGGQMLRSHFTGLSFIGPLKCVFCHAQTVAPVTAFCQLESSTPAAWCVHKNKQNLFFSNSCFRRATGLE